MEIKNVNDEIDLDEATQESINTITSRNYLQLSLSEWRQILPEECQVYVFAESYLAKRFDEINYQFCGEDSAKRILTDNLYALLRYKYFPILNDEIDVRITQIINSFTSNLKTTLIRVSFDEHDIDKESQYNKVNFIPDGSIAFKNGVFDFVNNEWLFKYDITNMPKLHNKIYTYDKNYIVFWYFNCNFEPRNDIEILKDSIEDVVKIMKKESETKHNYCFELMYNMSHSVNDIFSINQFKHLCEILGYVCLQSFSQNFVMLIGSGQNGKNSLFDGCFTYWVRPRPASNSLESIEDDRFITGTLENKSHNLFLESTAKTYTESTIIKALTGSMYQTIESKGIQKYSGLINCKFVFAGNDQDNIKFSDNTVGFRRRINILEIPYRWDFAKSFLRHGDYYDTTFSDNLVELTSDVDNLITLVYFAMYGIKEATNNFTQSFKFSYNDYKLPYSTLNETIKNELDKLTLDDIVKYINESAAHYKDAKTAFYTVDTKLPLHKAANIASLKTFDDVVKMFESPEESANFFANHDIYIQIKFLQAVSNTHSNNFTKDLKDVYQIKKLVYLYANTAYIRCGFNGRKLVIKR